MGEAEWSVNLKLASSGAIKGALLAETLVFEAKRISRGLRQTVDDTCVQDLKLLLEDELPRTFTREQIEYLYSAAFAGGSYAALNLPARIRKLDPSILPDDLLKLCGCIEALISSRKSLIDSVRVTANSVASVFGNIMQQELFNFVELQNMEFQRLEKEHQRLRQRRIVDRSDFDIWIKDSVAFYRRVSDIRSQTALSQTEKNDVLMSARRKKGFVSTKSIDTYEKRVSEFVSDFVVIDNVKVTESTSPVLLEITQYQSFKPDLREVKGFVKEHFLESSLAKYAQFTGSNKKSSTSEVHELEHYIDNRVVKISFSPRILPESAEQVINSLQAQLASKRSEGKARHRIGDSFLLVEVPGLRKGDLEEISTVLKSNFSR